MVMICLSCSVVENVSHLAHEIAKKLKAIRSVPSNPCPDTFLSGKHRFGVGRSRVTERHASALYICVYIYIYIMYLKKERNIGTEVGLDGTGCGL